MRKRRVVRVVRRVPRGAIVDMAGLGLGGIGLGFW